MPTQKPQSNNAGNSFINRSLLTAQNQQGQPTQQIVALRTGGDINNNRLPAPTNRKYTDADYAQHIRQLKTRLPSDEFEIVLQKPFVVVGDGGIENVKRTATSTVKWAVDKIKQDYFSKDPEFIIDVWLFKNPASYKKHNVKLFGSAPDRASVHGNQFWSLSVVVQRRARFALRTKLHSQRSHHWPYQLATARPKRNDFCEPSALL